MASSSISSILVLFGVFFIVLGFLPLYAFLPACEYWYTSPTLTYQHNTIDQEIGFLAAGSNVRLELNVYTGAQRVYAQVLDGGFNNVTQEVLVDGSGFIAFAAPKNDYYVVRLSYPIYYDYYNPQANNEQAQVQVYYSFYDYILFTFGIVMFGLGLALIINNGLKRRGRNKLASPPK
jgi:hypothetical protein